MGTLTINTVDGTGWGTEPVAGMNAVWSQAVSDLQTALVPSGNNVSVTITRQFISISGAGQSNWTADTTSYANIRTAYLNLTPSNSIQIANWTSANIPSVAPTTQLATFMQGPDSLSVALGRLSGSTTGTVSLNSSGSWDTSTLRGETGGSARISYGVIMHEITECLGRGANADSGGSGQTQPMDNFVFSAAGTHCTTKATTRYISVAGGGVTPELYFMNTGSGDAGDALTGTFAFNANATTGAAVSRSSSLPLLATDWQWLSLLGYNLSTGVGGGLDWAGYPINSVAPTVSGSLIQGQTLSITGDGTWTNSPTFTYQWLRDGITIGGATNSTYMTQSADIGHNISLFQTGTGASAFLNTTATSNSLGPIVTSVIPGVGLIGLRR